MMQIGRIKRPVVMDLLLAVVVDVAATEGLFWSIGELYFCRFAVFIAAMKMERSLFEWWLF